MINKCIQCGICCKLFLINLTKAEYQSGKYKLELGNFDLQDDFQKAKKYGVNILKQNQDGSCIYLKNNRCAIHEFRPQVCKDFFCNLKSKKFQLMIGLIKKNIANHIIAKP